MDANIKDMAADPLRTSYPLTGANINWATSAKENDINSPRTAETYMWQQQPTDIQFKCLGYGGTLVFIFPQLNSQVTVQQHSHEELVASPVAGLELLSVRGVCRLLQASLHILKNEEPVRQAARGRQAQMTQTSNLDLTISKSTGLQN